MMSSNTTYKCVQDSNKRRRRKKYELPLLTHPHKHIISKQFRMSAQMGIIVCVNFVHNKYGQREKHTHRVYIFAAVSATRSIRQQNISNDITSQKHCHRTVSGSTNINRLKCWLHSARWTKRTTITKSSGLLSWHCEWDWCWYYLLLELVFTLQPNVWNR